MIGWPAGVAGVTDMRRGMDSLSALIPSALGANPFCGQLFIFRGRRSDQVKVLW